MLVLTFITKVAVVKTGASVQCRPGKIVCVGIIRPKPHTVPGRLEIIRAGTSCGERVGAHNFE